jgi:Uma2 family endonuclease
MQTLTKNQLSLAEFLILPDEDITYELIEGEAIPKMSPKRFHSRITLALSSLLEQWNQTQENPGEVGIEWAITLKKNGKDWCPVPDLLYVSSEQLKEIPVSDVACSVPPELVIEIISPNQSFSNLSEKAIAYLNAGVKRVWLIDTPVKKVTIFYPNSLPQVKQNNNNLGDDVLPNFSLTPGQIFPSVNNLLIS